MITPENARKDYEAAVSALQQIAMAPGMSAIGHITSRDAIREFTSRYLGDLKAEIGALTNQYENFIASIVATINTLKGEPTPVSLLDVLNGIVTSSARRDTASEAPSRRGTRSLAGRRVRRDLTAADSDPLRILCVHGVGHQENDPAFEGVWRDAITAGLTEWTLARAFEIEFVAYDDVFAGAPLSAFDVAKAVVKLGVSGLVHNIGDLFRRRRGFGDVTEAVRWTAGMVVQWAENNDLRAAARKRVLDHTTRFNPHVILSHSLGSLLSYDAFARIDGRALIANRTFVTFGSQIGNAFVRSTLGGRIEPLDDAKQWYHLYNPHDDAFTASLRIPASNFEQVDAEFDIAGILDHDAAQYLRHPNTLNIVWRAIALPSSADRRVTRDLSISEVTLTQQAYKARPAKINKPRRRALLVGINDYPTAADRLEGCVNDVFLMSSLLQESGFDAEDIRVVLNERATARGIVDRLEWLLDGAEDGEERVFYYSGHGAQIPGYGVGEKVDRKDECLVPYDFNWSRERAVTDDQFYDLYSQLPYGTKFLTILDCCHSGGMTRDGAARVRGLTPPDDIRHRELKWDMAQEMWVPRDFSIVKENVGERKKRAALFGENGDLNRLGRSANLRTDRRSFKRACKDFDHKGPFMPIIFQACEEKQYSFEYRHGAQSYGAFTYSLGVIMRAARRRKIRLSWTKLIDATGEKLRELQYDQSPCLICPTALKNQTVPWDGK